MGSIGNYYRILDVPYDASFSEIKEAYRIKVKEVHPDKEKGNAEQFKRVKEAYEVLKDAEKRKRYDELLIKKAETVQQNPAKTSPVINMVTIRRKNKKQVTLSHVIINAALIFIGVMGNKYLNKKKLYK